MSGSCHCVRSTGAYERNNRSKWTANLMKTDSAESPQSTHILNLSLCLSHTSLTPKCKKWVEWMCSFLHSITSIISWVCYSLLYMSHYVVVGRQTHGKVWESMEIVYSQWWKPLFCESSVGLYIIEASYIFSWKLLYCESGFRGQAKHP